MDVSDAYDDAVSVIQSMDTVEAAELQSWTDEVIRDYREQTADAMNPSEFLHHLTMVAFVAGRIFQSAEQVDPHEVEVNIPMTVDELIDYTRYLREQI